MKNAKTTHFSLTSSQIAFASDDRRVGQRNLTPLETLENWEEQQLAAKVYQSLGQLDPFRRDAVIAMYNILPGLRVQDVAVQYGVSLATVYRAVKQAIDALRSEFGEYLNQSLSC